jgi:hypothetical protein
MGMGMLEAENGIEMGEGSLDIVAYGTKPVPHRLRHMA